MNKFFLFSAIFLLFLPLFSLQVDDVAVEGTIRTEQSILTQYFKEKRDYSEKEINEILEKIIAIEIFEDVSIYYDDTKHLLKFKVVEFPIIRSVKFSGNKKIDNDDIKEVLTVKKNELLDMNKISKNTAAILGVYHDKGFLSATVDADVALNKEKQEVNIDFKISEGKKSRVKKVTIVGNKYLSEAELKKYMAVQEDGLFSIFNDGGYKKSALEESMGAITYLYNENGFVDVKVSKPTVTISKDKRDIYISYIVEEGKRYKVGEYAVEGDPLDSGKLPDMKFTQKPGEWYQHSKTIRDFENLKKIYGNEGYPFVEILPGRHLNDREQSVDMNFIVRKGEKCFIEEVSFTGNDRTRDKVLRREMEISEGDLFNYSRQKESEYNLKRTGFYDEVKIEVVKGSSPNMAKMVVTVKERKSGTFNVGAGFSSFESFLFNAKVEQNNFLGYGQSLSLAGQLSRMRREVSLSFYEPWFVDSNVSFNVSFYYRYLNYDSDIYEYYADYSQNSFGFSVTFGIPLAKYLRAYLGYKLKKVDINGATEHQMNYLYRDIFSSGLTARLALDMRNDRMYATKGIYVIGGAEYFPRWMGSDEDILNLDFNFRWYQELFLGVVFRTNIELGYNIHLQNKPLPYAERFKLGGMYSVRGYPFYSIGPNHDRSDTDYNIPTDGKDPTSSTYPYIIGGDKQFIMNNELEIPIVKSMRISIVGFVDLGNSWAKDEHLFYINSKDKDIYDLPLGVLWSAGFGLRWVTPMAPLSFEWGFPLTPRPGDPKFQFEFNIKNSF